MASAVDSARAAGADFVVALPHWGEEYELLHSPVQEKCARFLVKKGVDAIIGSHPHVPQDTARIQGVPVVYSMGNVVSNMSAKNTRLGLAVALDFTIDRKTGEKKMLGPRLRWTWCTLPGRLCSSYSTLFVDEWLDKSDKWLIPSDFDNMKATLSRVGKVTGIGR